MSILSQFKQSQNTDFPNVRPSLDLRFALAKKLDPRITFTRGSTGTYFGSDGIMRTAGVNEPRFDHDPITGQSLGLMVEESRTNLIVGSNSFGGGTADYGVTASATTSPDGTTNASLIYEKTTNNFKIHSVGFTAVIGTSYCASAFVKYAGSSKYGRLKAGSTNTIIINLTNGTILSSTGTCGVIPYPNGWYRIYSIFTATSTSENLQLFLMNYNGALSQYQGDGSSGYYVYGMQAEAGAFATSYIPTTASIVPRSADNAFMTGTNFSSWYNSSEGSLFVAARVNALGGSGFPGIAYVDDGTVNNSMGFYVSDAGSDNIGAESYISGRAQYTLFSSSATTANKLNKAISSYSINNFAGAFDTSSQIQRDTSGSIPTVNRLRIGALRGGLFPLNGTISRLTYYPIQLTNQQLINLTS